MRISGCTTLTRMPEGPVAYELMSVSNDLHWDSKGMSVGFDAVNVIANRIEGSQRIPLTLYPASGATHAAVLRHATATRPGPPQATATATATALKSAVWARFDLVTADKVDSPYADTDVLAVLKVNLTHDGLDGEPGAFTSTVFMRSETRPGTPSGGTYADPVPSGGWSDGVPGGDAETPVWMSTARMLPTMTGAASAPRPEWSTPTPANNSVGVEIIWNEEENPVEPSDDHPYGDGNAGWNTAPSANTIWMAMSLKNNGVWEPWQVTRIKGEAGPKGEDTITLDLDNEVEGIVCDASGEPTDTPPLAGTTASVYVGTAKESPGDWNFSVSCSGCTATVAANGYVSVQTVTEDSATVRVTASRKRDGASRSAVMSLYKVRPGKEGEAATLYSLQVSASAIRLGRDGTMDPPTVAVMKRKTTGNVTEDTSEKILRYERVGYDAQVWTVNAKGCLIKDYTASCTSIRIWLYDDDGTTVLDSETIPIVRDGEDGPPGPQGDKGNPGQDAVMYRLALTPSQLTYDLNESKYDCTEVRATVTKIAGKTETAVTGLSSEGLSLSIDVYDKEGAYHHSASSGDGRVTLGAQYSRIDFILKKAGVTVASQTLGIVTTGKNGTSGKNGVWVPPPMQWADYKDGYRFEQGDLDADPKETKMDMVLERVESTDVYGRPVEKLIPYVCIQSHAKGAPGTLRPLDDNAENPQFWRTADSGVWKFMATDLLWANVGQINFLNSQSIRVGDQSGMCGYFGVPADGKPGGAVFYSGGDNPTDASYVVYGNGVVRCGNETGKRITLNPANQSLEAYGEDNVVRYRLSGEAIDVNSPIPSGATVNRTGSRANMSVTVDIPQDSAEDYECTETQTKSLLSVPGTLVTNQGTVKVTIPAVTLSPAFVEGRTLSTSLRIDYTLKVNGAYAGSHYAEVTREYGSGAPDTTISGSTDGHTLSASVKAGDSVELVAEATAYFFGLPGAGNAQTATATVTQSADVTAQVIYEGMLTQIGSNGMVISRDSNNYVYFLFGADGLRCDCRSNGTRVFKSANVS